MGYRELLALPRLSVISAEPDHELDRIARTIGAAAGVRVAGPAAFAALLDGLAGAATPDARIAPKTLDLLGHSTAAAAHLRLGDWGIDATSPAGRRWFGELAARAVLPRIGVRAVRLLACRTAATEAGRATICALAEILGIEVWGTSHLLHAGHYGPHGFLDAWQFMLVESRELRRTERAPPPAPDRAGPSCLDLAALPARALDPRPRSWPRWIATAKVAGQILRLIRRDAGAPMPGLSAPPSCELALPSATPHAYHIAEVLLDGAFLRFFPEPEAPGVAYPVDDASALNRLLRELAARGVSP